MFSKKHLEVDVPGADLDALKARLQLTRFPDELEDAGWDYDVPLAVIRHLVQRWTDGYDCRKAEKEVNKLQMFTRDIDVGGFGTLNIHYVHQTRMLFPCCFYGLVIS